MAATLHHTAIISHYSKSNLLFRSASHSPAQISLQNGLFSEFSALKFRSRAATSWVLKSRDLRSGAGLRCEAAQQEAVLDVQNVNDMTWKPLVLDADGPVLVEFYAPWCGPCRMIHPVIDELSKEYAGKIKCYKLSTDESPSIATAYGIRSIPTTLILVNGEKKDLILGAVPKPVLSASIEKYL